MKHPGQRIAILVLFGFTLLYGADDPARTESAQPGTLEDIYGDSGNTFQAAVGFINFEGTAASQAQQGYGLAVDDMVVKWREFTLEPDETDCEASGSCATIEVASSIVYEGEAVLTVTVLETTPPASNDCDLDGADDATDDCDGDGTPDLIGRATSSADIAGESVVLNRVGTSATYQGAFAVSAYSGGAGVLFIAQQGSDDPVVTVTYLDDDDGTGQPCPNSVDPAQHGIVQTFATVFLSATCEIVVAGSEFTDNGDHDLYVDTDETVAMRLRLVNNCGFDLHHCAAWLSTNDPDVDCILDPALDVGDLADSSEVVLTDDAFLWKLAGVERTNIEENLSAVFNVTIQCDEIDGLSAPQSVSLPLDLDLDDFGQTPVSWIEGFEGGTLGSFEAENLDGGIPGANNTEGLFNGDGWRCQFSDPDWPNSNSYGQDTGLDCYPGANLAASQAIYWQVDGIDTGSPDGGRAKSGSYSMYYGIYLTDPAGEFTTPMAQVESVRTTDPINLGTIAPELGFWHQASLLDGRFLNIDPDRTQDRGVVQIKTVDAAGNDTSFWMRLEPYKNPYSVQAYDFYFNCKFDPIDDGTTEDDFFDPEDPDRRLGPSSTCHPMFTFSCQGDTNEPFSTTNLCNAAVPPSPGDAPNLGTGTWVESKVDLSGFRGKRVKLRFLVTGLKASAETKEDQFDAVNPGEWDNGWWVDDITIDETLESPAELVPDTDVVRHCAGDLTLGCITLQDCVDAGVAGPCEGEAPQCGPTCAILVAAATTIPDTTGGPLDETLPAPGQAISIDASGSSGSCLGGSLQYRFSADDGPVLREWSGNPVATDAPAKSESYLVEVRCSSDTTCHDSVNVQVDVGCPDSGTLGGPFPDIVTAESKILFTWTTPLAYDVFTGDLSDAGTYLGVLASGDGSSFAADATPSRSGGFYYVVRKSGEYCNDTGSWATGGAGENPLRDSALP